MLFKEVIAIYTENHEEFINIKYTLTEKAGGTYTYCLALRG
jgi:hypothetical protein